MQNKSNKMDSLTRLGLRTVIFVDAEMTDLYAIQQLFSDDTDMRLMMASSGEKALEIVRKEDVCESACKNDPPIAKIGVQN